MSDPIGETEGYHQLPSRSIKAMYMGSAIIIAILTLFPIGYFCCIDRINGAYRSLLSISIIAIYAVCVAYLLAYPIVFFRHYRYRIGSDDLDVRRGVIFHSHAIVPVERIHQVQVTRGPIDRRFDLADVTVTTAGGQYTMVHLDVSEAEDIASKLDEIIVRLLKARDRCPNRSAIIRSHS